MPAPRKIPPNLEPDLLRLTGEGKTADFLTTWLRKNHGIEMTSRGVSKWLQRRKEERAPITRALVVEKLSKTVTADLDAVDGIIERALEDERAAVKHEDVIEELERLALADMKDAVDAKTGKLLALDKMPENIRRAISSIEIEELYEGTGRERERVGDLVKVKFWDKNKAVELLVKSRAKVHARELALKARDQQLRARAFRLELAGAGGPRDDASAVRERLKKKLEAAEKG